MKKKIISIVLFFILIFSITTTSFAQSNQPDLQTAKSKVEQALLEENIDASVQILDNSDTSSFLRYLKSENSVIELSEKLASDHYSLDSYRSSALEILDNTSDNGAIFACEIYQNNLNDTIVVTYLYDVASDKLELTYAQKITENFEISDYFAKHEITSSKWRSFNVESFICSMGGAIACTAYSAMLMALVPLSIAAGMTCSTAFAWVCSHY